MTFREFMRENGYELQTTFWEDFSIADRFGLSAIQDTFKRAFEEWKNNYKSIVGTDGFGMQFRCAACSGGRCGGCAGMLCPKYGQRLFSAIS